MQRIRAQGFERISVKNVSQVEVAVAFVYLNSKRTTQKLPQVVVW